MKRLTTATAVTAAAAFALTACGVENTYETTVVDVREPTPQADCFDADGAAVRATATIYGGSYRSAHGVAIQDDDGYIVAASLVTDAEDGTDTAYYRVRGSLSSGEIALISGPQSTSTETPEGTGTPEMARLAACAAEEDAAPPPKPAWTPAPAPDSMLDYESSMTALRTAWDGFPQSVREDACANDFYQDALVDIYDARAVADFKRQVC